MLQTDYITKCVETNTPVSFLKFGDGEYLCAFCLNELDNNCDGDKYTLKLSNALKSSFSYLVENTENTFFGKWPNPEVSSKWESLVNTKVNWSTYHTILLDMGNNDNKIKLYKTIKYSNLKKIIVCNELLLKSKYLLNIDHQVFVPTNCWFNTQFNNILQQIINIIGDIDEPHIVITCCGMSAKVLLTELRKKYFNEDL